MTPRSGRLAAALFALVLPALSHPEETAVLMGSWGQGLFRLPPGDSAKWEAYGKNLPQNFITFTTVDSKGTIYCGFDLPGLWFSRDSGATWETTKGTPPEKPSGLAIHPDNPLILLLTTWGKGAWWSEDGGLSWSRDDSPSAFMRKPLAVKSGSQTVFYALSNNQNIVSASGLRGAWKEAAKLPRGLKVWDMAVRDADKGTMLVATDAGIAEIGPDGAVDFPKLGIASAFTRSVLVLPDRVLIGTWGDGVIEWKKDGAKFINDGLADRNAFALCAISAASVGKAETGGATGPATWTAMNNGLLNFKVKNVVASRQNEKVLYCGTDSGVHRSDDGGANWRQVAGGLSDMAIYRVTVSQSNSELVYCSTWNSGVSRSSDGGKSWAQINKGMTTLNTMMVEVDGQNPQTVYAATWGGGLFKSADGGDSWSDFNTGLSSQNTYFVFSGRASPNPVIGSLDTAGLFAFQDGKWVDANKGMNFGWVMWMAQDPANGKRLVACTAGSGIYLSEDGGLSWAQKNTGLTNQQIKSAAFHPGKPGVIYAGTDGGGVFKSTDGGASWAQDNGGLSAMTVRDILITAAGMVYLSTDNGVFARQD